MSAAVAELQSPLAALPVAQIVADIRRDLKRNRKTERGDYLLSQLMTYAKGIEQHIAAQKQRIAELENLSMTDELTGLPNLRAFNQFLTQTLARAKRHQESGVIGYFDLDGFKTINDKYGHRAGDAALLHVGNILRTSIRASDHTARLHGDEFAVVLIHSDYFQGAQRLRTIAQDIENKDFAVGGIRIALRISVGSAPFTGTESLESLLKAADSRMYQTKLSKTQS